MYVSVDCSSTIEDISRRAQDLVEKINIRRINDQKMIDNFQEKLVEKVHKHFSGFCSYFLQYCCLPLYI